MSNISDTYSTIRGFVDLHYVRDDGSKIPICVHHNVVLNSANKLLAGLVSGDARLRPTHVVFSRGTEPITLLPDKSSDYHSLVTGLTPVTAPLLTPTVSNGDQSCSVTFTTHTGLGDYKSTDFVFNRAILVCRLSEYDIIPFSVVNFPAATSSGAYVGIYWTIEFGEQQVQQQAQEE